MRKYLFLVVVLICATAQADGTVVIDSRMAYKKSSKCAQLDKMWGEDFKRRDPEMGPKALSDATSEHDKREVAIMADLKVKLSAYLAERGYKKVIDLAYENDPGMRKLNVDAGVFVELLDKCDSDWFPAPVEGAGVDTGRN